MLHEDKNCGATDLHLHQPRRLEGIYEQFKAAIYGGKSGTDTMRLPTFEAEMRSLFQGNYNLIGVNHVQTCARSRFDCARVFA